MTPNFRDVFFIAPEIVLTVWGLVVLLVDLGLARRLNPTDRRRTVGWLALVGVGIALAAAAIVCFVPLMVRAYPIEEHSWLSLRDIAYFNDADPAIFFGTLAGDIQTAFFNILFVALLGLIIGLSMSWSFTEEWGEYFALMFWATVGMMLLTASEELITLFLTLETMTICLYLSTAMEKTKRRSAEGGLKYFVYGSVSSAAFLFGLSLIYGMTGTTSFDGIPKNPRRRGNDRPVGQRRRRHGDSSLACRFRFQGRRSPVSSVGARRLRRSACARDGVDRDGLEACQLRRIHEGVLTRTAPVGEPDDQHHGAGLDRHHRDRFGGHDDVRQLRRPGTEELQTDAGILIDRACRLYPGRRGGRQYLDRGTSRGRLGTLLPDRLCFCECRCFRGRRLAGPRPGQRQHRRLERPRFSGAASGNVYLDSHAFTDRHTAPGGVLRQTLSLHGGAQPDGSVSKGHPDVAGGTWAHELRGLGVLLRARSQGDVPARARARNKKTGAPRQRDLHAHCAGNRRRCGLRLDARLAHEHDAGRRRSHVDQSGRPALPRFDPATANARPPHLDRP